MIRSSSLETIAGVSFDYPSTLTVNTVTCFLCRIDVSGCIATHKSLRLVVFWKPRIRALEELPLPESYLVMAEWHGGVYAMLCDGHKLFGPVPEFLWRPGGLPRE